MSITRVSSEMVKLSTLLTENNLVKSQAVSFKKNEEYQKDTKKASEIKDTAVISKEAEELLKNELKAQKTGCVEEQKNDKINEFKKDLTQPKSHETVNDKIKNNYDINKPTGNEQEDETNYKTGNINPYDIPTGDKLQEDETNYKTGNINPYDIPTGDKLQEGETNYKTSVDGNNDTTNSFNDVQTSNKTILRKKAFNAYQKLII